MLKISLKNIIVAGAIGGLLIKFFPYELPVTIVGILLILIWFPLLILGVFDRIDKIEWVENKSTPSTMMRILLATPKALLGLVSILFGVSIVVWVFYNVFIERQPLYTGPDLVYSLSSFGIGPALIFMGRYWIVSAFDKNADKKGDSIEPIESSHF
jgi:uncharacterized membrane protein YfcA